MQEGIGVLTGGAMRGEMTQPNAACPCSESAAMALAGWVDYRPQSSLPRYMTSWAAKHARLLLAFSGEFALTPWRVPWQRAWLRAWQLPGRVPLLPSWLRQLPASLAPWLGRARQQASWLQAWPGGEQGQLQGNSAGTSVHSLFVHTSVTTHALANRLCTHHITPRADEAGALHRRDSPA